VEAVVAGVPVLEETFREKVASKALRDEVRVVPQRREVLPKHRGVLSILRHPVHLRLELLRLDGPLPELAQGAALPQDVGDLGLEDRPRHHLLEGRLGLGVLFGPDAVGVGHPLQGLLRHYPLPEGQWLAGEE
jgi:hypothetical protein